MARHRTPDLPPSPPLRPVPLSQIRSPSMSTTMSTSSSGSIPDLTQENQIVPTCQFTNVVDLFDIIDQTPGDVLIVSGVLPTQYDEIETYRDDHCKKQRFFYDTASHILIVTLPTEEHETMWINLWEVFREHLATQGNSRNFRTMGSRTTRNHNQSSKEADTCGGPVDQRGGKGQWPTLVIESGYSQTLPSLRQAMRWWFSASNHQVKIVLLVKYSQQQDILLIEKWEEETVPMPPGPVTQRRAAAALRPSPVLRQSISITRTNPTTYNVTRAPLILGFRSLFLRDPVGPDEGDIIISVQDLQWYGNRIWSLLESA